MERANYLLKLHSSDELVDSKQMIKSHLAKLGELARGAEDFLEMRSRFANVVQQCFRENRDTEAAVAGLTQKLLQQKFTYQDFVKCEEMVKELDFCD